MNKSPTQQLHILTDDPDLEQWLWEKHNQNLKEPKFFGRIHPVEIQTLHHGQHQSSTANLLGRRQRYLADLCELMTLHLYECEFTKFIIIIPLLFLEEQRPDE